MAKKVVNNFNGGELSPYLYGRSDFPKYNTGCVKLENFIPLTYGGVTKRPSSKSLDNTKDNNKTRLIPFTVNVTDNYVLEFTANLIRIYKGESLLDVEIGTNYSENDLNDINFIQSVDVLFLCHKDYPVSSLSRYSESNWVFEEVLFDFPPLLEDDLSGTKIFYDNENRKLVANSNAFVNNHVGAYWVLKEPRTDNNSHVFSGNVDIDYAVNYSEAMNVSYSNWSIDTVQGANNVYIERSFDNINWERYVTVGIHEGKAAAAPDKTFTFASLEPESFNTFIRVAWEGKTEPDITVAGMPNDVGNGVYIQITDINERNAWQLVNDDGTFTIQWNGTDKWEIVQNGSALQDVTSDALMPPTDWSANVTLSYSTTDTGVLEFDLKADSEYLISLYKITDVIDSQNAEVIVISNPSFDTENIDEWNSATSYTTGKTVKYTTTSDDLVVNKIRTTSENSSNVRTSMFDPENSFYDDSGANNASKWRMPYRWGGTDGVGDANTWDWENTFSRSTGANSAGTKPDDVMSDVTTLQIGSNNYLAHCNGASITVRLLEEQANFKFNNSGSYDQTVKYVPTTLYSAIPSVSGQVYSTLINDEQLFAVSKNFLEEKNKILVYTRNKYNYTRPSSETHVNVYKIWEVDVTNRNSSTRIIINPSEEIGEVHFNDFRISSGTITLSGSHAQLKSAQIFNGYIYFSLHFGENDPYGDINPLDHEGDTYILYRTPISNYVLENGKRIYKSNTFTKVYGKAFGTPSNDIHGNYTAYSYMGSIDFYNDGAGTVLVALSKEYITGLYTGNNVNWRDSLRSFRFNKEINSFNEEPFFDYSIYPTVGSETSAITSTRDHSRGNLIYTIKESDGTIVTSQMSAFSTSEPPFKFVITSVETQALTLNIYESLESTTNDVPPNNPNKWIKKEFGTEVWAEGAFSNYRGHPEALAFYEKRLAFANTTYNPNTLWFSFTDNFYNFLTGTLDTESIKVTLNSGRLNEIKWLVPSQSLVIGTSGAEWTIGSEADDIPITPSRFALKERSTFGSNNINPLYVEGAVLFFMRQGRKLREWNFNYFSFESEVPDLTLLSEHITEGGIVSFAHQQQPNNILWMVRNDGELLGLTYDKGQKVFAWHRHAFKEDLNYLSLDGINDYVDAPHVNFQDDETIDLTLNFKLRQSSTEREWLVNQAGSFEIDIRANATNEFYLILGRDSTNANTITYNKKLEFVNDFTDNEWHALHITVDPTETSNNITATIDGVSTTSTSNLSFDFSGTTFEDSNQANYNFLIGNARAYESDYTGDEDLFPDDIPTDTLDLDLRELTLKVEDVTQFSYNFNETSETTVNDVSGNNDATVINSTTPNWVSETNTLKVESVSVLPNQNSEDNVYLVIKKGSKRHVCLLDNLEWGTNYATEFAGLDFYAEATVTVNNRIANFPLGGASHLAGEEVKVIIDGAIQPGFSIVLPDGSVEVTSIVDQNNDPKGDGSYKMFVGLPYTSTVAPMYFQDADLIGNKNGAHKALINFKDTLSAKVGQKETDLEKVRFEPLAHPTTDLKTNMAEVYFKNNNDYLQTLYIVSDDYKPCTILSLIVDIDE